MNTDKNVDTDGQDGILPAMPIVESQNSNKRVAPENANPNTMPVHPALLMVNAQSQQGPSPPQIAPRGSPAAEFLQTSPIRNPNETTIMTCDLAAIPRDKWNKRRTLSAIIISVFPIKTKAATVRRDVILRDQHSECNVTVWGNHTNIVNEGSIGKPITMQRICLTEYEGKLQIAMPKDSAVLMGSTHLTAPIMQWLNTAGSVFHTVSQVSN